MTEWPRVRLDVVLRAPSSTSGPSTAQYAPRAPSYGMPTLPGLTTRRPVGEPPVVLHVGMPADEHVRVDCRRASVDSLVGVMRV